MTYAATHNHICHLPDVRYDVTSQATTIGNALLAVAFPSRNQHIVVFTGPYPGPRGPWQPVHWSFQCKKVMASLSPWHSPLDRCQMSPETLYYLSRKYTSSVQWWTLQSPSSWGFGYFWCLSSRVCDIQKSIVLGHDGWWGCIHAASQGGGITWSRQLQLECSWQHSGLSSVHGQVCRFGHMHHWRVYLHCFSGFLGFP